MILVSGRSLVEISRFAGNARMEATFTVIRNRYGYRVGFVVTWVLIPYFAQLSSVVTLGFDDGLSAKENTEVKSAIAVSLRFCVRVVI